MAGFSPLTCELHASYIVCVVSMPAHMSMYVTMSHGSGPSGIEHTASASEESPTLHTVGKLPKHLAQSFQQELLDRLKEAQKLTGDQRSATNGAQSHQRTPSFMLSLLQNAIRTVLTFHITAPVTKVEKEALRLKEKSHDKAPQGGVTDVGLHTGGKPRHTTWPLVCAVLHVSDP
jgi:hypothetical protein